MLEILVACVADRGEVKTQFIPVRYTVILNRKLTEYINTHALYIHANSVGLECIISLSLIHI